MNKLNKLYTLDNMSDTDIILNNGFQNANQLIDYINNLKDDLDKQNKKLKNKIKINEKSRRKMQQSLMKRIQQLDNIRNKSIDFLKENASIDEDNEYFCDDLRYDDCKKLFDILRSDRKC